MLVKHNGQTVVDPARSDQTIAANAGDEFGSTRVLSTSDVWQIQDRYECGAQTTCPGYTPPKLCADVGNDQAECESFGDRTPNPCRWDTGGRFAAGPMGCGVCHDLVYHWQLDGFSSSIGCAEVVNSWTLNIGGTSYAFDCAFTAATGKVRLSSLDPATFGPSQFTASVHGSAEVPDRDCLRRG